MYCNFIFMIFFLCLFHLIYLTNVVSLKKKLFIHNVGKLDTCLTPSMGILNKRKLSLCDKKEQIIKRFILKDNNLKNSVIKKKKESDIIEMNGIVEECLANTNFIVSIKNGEKFLCFISGKLRVNKVKINLGDTVKIQIHKLNFEQRRGKIIYRYLQQTPIKRKR
ncbi:translation initiation factor IF-1, putative [Plasmodium berghei]|uniref:Translation initiation factor IF-1, putative n=2 Tax=Plasmodium berghei TaxID=5821 RepID=A0A509ANW5_PLABA|nr:translation initiation factor IF-1, putative [Plasmodium berghei ANKA]CXI96490.1 translation initiation factor IF-1, putative [Plasmodium berghei]SCL97338.1 translation initiation factor IF-1, putative [Plasmodium berghei]SCM16597.1 translation initiation factor IF-1, putative [Plasmodium berghei]SCM18394.1 translation initiation factor IF-1, putative [Plasmodium berghei]SCN27824.1 translation initiation factor IF-1, putative [Plasmodium berghei]|eukprot:XP_034423478.1 translation initiation factor IF-1, putative [Plasmodium berghei ANKA]